MFISVIFIAISEDMSNGTAGKARKVRKAGARTWNMKKN